MFTDEATCQAADDGDVELLDRSWPITAGTILDSELSPDGSRLKTVRGGQDGTGTVLTAVPIEGGEPVVLDDSATSGRTAYQFTASTRTPPNASGQNCATWSEPLVRTTSSR